MRSKISETQLVLHPPSDLLECVNCHVKYVKRPKNHEDRDDLCLKCNREEWSCLWPKDDKKESETETIKRQPKGDWTIIDDPDYNYDYSLKEIGDIELERWYNDVITNRGKAN